MAYITGPETATEGVMCSLGYSNTTSGLCAALVFIGGFAGSIVIGFTGKYIQPKIVVKICSGLMVLILVGQIFVMQTRHFGWLFGLSYSSFGFFAIG
jgi:MFS-type transporter involved in bile tolerance (Atg22 family)